jgi:hypothetical protein
MTQTESVRELPGRHWISFAIVIGCALVLVALLIPAVHQARQAAQKTQSRNNLKQLALAVHNYQDVYSCLPLGGDVRDDGTAMHGWYTRLIPYLDASDLYSRINLHLPWDHPVQLLPFRRTLPIALIPGVEPQSSGDGYGLLHYPANPNAMHRNHCITIDEMTTGTANNWLFGEASGNYQPWGYPFNWRFLDTPFNSGPAGYGIWPDGCNIGLADGSVRFLSSNTDAAVLTTLANAPPVATSAQMSVPERRIKAKVVPMREVWFAADVEINSKRSLGTTILYDEMNRPYYADVYCVNNRPVWDVGQTTRIDLEGVLENFPEIRVLNVGVVNDDDAALIARFPDLELLQAREYELTEKGRAVLNSSPTLRTVARQ